MSEFVPVESPGGIILVEVESVPDTGPRLAALPRETHKNFAETVEAMKKNAEHLIDAVVELSPQEVEVSFSITAGVEAGGNTFFALARASTEGSYTVTLKWKEMEEERKE